MATFLPNRNWAWEVRGILTPAAFQDPPVNPEQSHALLEAAIPPQDIYSFHVLMIRHGRQVSHAIRPKCDECALRPLCDYGRGLGAK